MTMTSSFIFYNYLPAQAGVNSIILSLKEELVFDMTRSLPKSFDGFELNWGMPSSSYMGCGDLVENRNSVIGFVRNETNGHWKNWKLIGYNTLIEAGVVTAEQIDKYIKAQEQAVNILEVRRDLLAKGNDAIAKYNKESIRLQKRLDKLSKKYDKKFEEAWGVCWADGMMDGYSEECEHYDEIMSVDDGIIWDELCRFIESQYYAMADALAEDE